MLLNSSKPIAEEDAHFIAKNIYNLTPAEYEVVKNDNNFAINIKVERTINSFLRVDIITSGLYAGITLLPPLNGGQSLTKDMILEKILHAYNIHEDMLDNEVFNRLYDECYTNNIIVFREIIAEGRPAKAGTNALIKIFFDISVSKPKILPNGKVDYKDLTSYVFAKAGDVLLKRIPPTTGESGIAVTGAELAAVPGRDKIINALEGVNVDPDLTEYVAAINGQIVFNNTSIKINPFLTISGNVDYKSGNIKFLGTVDISGDALAGFAIDAEDVILHGIDEGSTITAKNSVIIKTGVKASKKGSITAGTDVAVGYSENANIRATRNIELNKYCFNSFLTADIITAVGKDSVVVGGTLEGFSEISLMSVGSKGSNDTLLAVGYRTDFIEKAERLSTEIEQLKESLEKMKEALSKVDLNDKKVLENPKVKKIIEAMALLKKRLPLLIDKKEEYSKNSIYPTPVIKIAGTIFAGVKLKFFDTYMPITTNMNKVRFYYDRATNEIQFSTL